MAELISSSSTNFAQAFLLQNTMTSVGVSVLSVAFLFTNDHGMLYVLITFIGWVAILEFGQSFRVGRKLVCEIKKQRSDAYRKSIGQRKSISIGCRYLVPLESLSNFIASDYD